MSGRAGGAGKAREVAQGGLFLALLIVSAQLSVAVGPVPFTLQTFVVALVALLLPPGRAAGLLASYVVLGGLGLPVFSLWRGGPAMLVGPTGGFLYGFVAAACAGALARQALGRLSRTDARLAVAADVACVAVVLLVTYAVGTAHFMAVCALGGEPSGVGATLALTVAPFLIPDAVKAAAAISVARALRRHM